MTVELTNTQYGTMARALVVIASGKRVSPDGKLKNIPRIELIERAREAAAYLELQYFGDGGGNSSFPQEIGLEHRRKKS